MGYKGFLLGAAAALTVLATAGCTATVSAGGVASTTSAQPAGSPMTTSRVAGTSAAPARLQFPNTTLNVMLTGYDDSTGMLRFQLATWVRTPTDDGGYQADPANPGTHRLPLADNPTILSAGTLCAGSNDATIGPSGLGTKPCSEQEFLATLHGAPGGLPAAQLKVDGSDRITSVVEYYHP